MCYRFIFLFIFVSQVFFVHTEAKDRAFFQAHRDQPYHLSIGAVLFDHNGHIACHHFKDVMGHKEVYILMRESMENDESIFTTLHRGLKEEFGSTSKPIAFLGCLSGNIPNHKLMFEKTTLYIACQVLEWSPENRDPNDPEASSIIEWLEPEVLITIMEDQGKRFQRVDADESEIIRRAIPYIQKTLSDTAENS